MSVGLGTYVDWNGASNLGAPFTLTPPVISGTTSVGNNLSSTNGTYSSGATITHTYQWLRNSVAISGATANTYTLVSDDVGKTIVCIVTATNSYGAINVTSNSLGPIAA